MNVRINKFDKQDGRRKSEVTQKSWTNNIIVNSVNLICRLCRLCQDITHAGYNPHKKSG